MLKNSENDKSEIYTPEFVNRIESLVKSFDLGVPNSKFGYSSNSLVFSQS